MGWIDRVRGYFGGREQREVPEPKATVAEVTGEQVAAEIAEQPGRLDLAEPDPGEEWQRAFEEQQERSDDVFWELIKSGEVVERGDWVESPDGRAELRTMILQTSEGWHGAVDHTARDGDWSDLNWSLPFATREEAEQNASDELADLLETIEAEMDEDIEIEPRMDVVKRGEWTRPEPEYEVRESILRDDRGYWCEHEKSYAVIGGDDYDALYGPFTTAELAERFGGIARLARELEDSPLMSAEAIRDVSRALEDHPNDQGLRGELATLIGAVGQNEGAHGLVTGAGMDRGMMRDLADAGQFAELAERMDDVIDRVRETIGQREDMVSQMARAATEAHICYDHAHEEAAGRELGR